MGRSTLPLVRGRPGASGLAELERQAVVAEELEEARVKSRRGDAQPARKDDSLRVVEQELACPAGEVREGLSQADEQLLHHHPGREVDELRPGESVRRARLPSAACGTWDHGQHKSAGESLGQHGGREFLRNAQARAGRRRQLRDARTPAVEPGLLESRGVRTATRDHTSGVNSVSTKPGEATSGLSNAMVLRVWRQADSSRTSPRARSRPPTLNSSRRQRTFLRSTSTPRAPSCPLPTRRR